MDKDQVLALLDAVTQVNYGDDDGDYSMADVAKARGAIESLYAEIESLRAMRKRVEDEIDQFDRSDVPVVNWCADVLRAALGDSHE